MKYLYLILLFFVFISVHSQPEYNYEYALIEAARQKSIGNVNEAIGLYVKCLEVNPASAVSAYELGSIYASANQFDLSETYLLKAYSLDPSNYWYLLAYSEILKINKKYKEVEKLIRNYLKGKYDNKLKYSLADIYVETGKEKRALKTLNEIEKDNGISEILILKKVDILKKLKDYDKGERELLKLIIILPEVPEYKILMAEYLVEVNQKEKAVYYFKEAYKLDSTNIYAITSLSEYYVDIKDLKTSFYYLEKALKHPAIKLENKIKTLAYYIGKDDMLKLYPALIRSLVNTLLLTYPDDLDVKNLALEYFFNIKDYENSYITILSILKNKTDNLMVWQQAIYIAGLINDYDEIINLSTSALAIFPNKPELKLFKGIALYQKNDFQKAYDILIESYDLGLDLGTQLQYLTFLGESAYKIGKKEEAYRYFEELLLLDSKNYGTMNNYSYYLSLEGVKLERAMELSKKTIDAEPENKIYLDTYGWILYRLEMYDESYRVLIKAVEGSDDPDVLFHFAEVLHSLGRVKEACEYYNLAMENGYDESEMKMKLEKCQ